MMIYKHCLEFYKLYKSTDQIDGWVELNYQHNFNNRQEMVQVIDWSNLRIGESNDNDLIKHE